MSRPRLLFVSPRFLFPMDQGGKIRTGNILKHLKSGAFEITLASPAPDNAAQYRRDVESASDRFVSWPEKPQSRIGRVLSLLSKLPVAVASDVSKAGSAVVATALAKKPDLVVIDFPHATVLAPERFDIASVMFTHNVEAEIFERHTEVTSGLLRLVWKNQAKKMRVFEGDSLRRYDSVIAVSARDGEALRKAYDLKTIEVIDTGVDLDFFAFNPLEAAPPLTADNGTIIFAGTMSWPANIDGIGFMMDEVWPLVLKARPNAKAVIVGRNPPKALIDKAAERGLDWTFPGFVDDIRPYVAGSHVYVIPLRVGSGTRIKAFEAIAMGRPVVSTRIGIEGLDIAHEEHFLAADTAEDFAAAILRLLDDPALNAALSKAARKQVEDRFSWSHVAREFEAICLRTLERREKRNNNS